MSTLHNCSANSRIGLKEQLLANHMECAWIYIRQLWDQFLTSEPAKPVLCKRWLKVCKGGPISILKLPSYTFQHKHSDMLHTINILTNPKISSLLWYPKKCCFKKFYKPRVNCRIRQVFCSHWVINDWKYLSVLGLLHLHVLSLIAYILALS